MAKKILVVDDEFHVIRLLESRLKSSGYDVITASDGEAGLNEARTKKPDLILLDVLMPGINGFEVCKRIKGDNNTRHIPVIMVTASAEEKDLCKSLNEGAFAFITKPFESKQLLGEIQRALNAG